MSRKKKFVKKSDLSMEDINAIARLAYSAMLEYYENGEDQEDENMEELEQNLKNKYNNNADK